MACALFIKNLKKLVLSVDMFGSQINLQIKKENEYHSIFGVTMSIGILALVYYSFLSLVIDMIDRKSPNVLQNIQYKADPEEHIMTEEDFLFQIVVSDNFGVPIHQKPDQQVYESKLQVCSRLTDQTNHISNSCKNFTLQQCSQLDLNKIILTKLNISQAQLDSSYCLDPKDWKSINLTLQGTPQSPTFKSLQFTVEKCVNSTSNKCASSEYIQNILKLGYVGFFVSDYLLNQQKEQNPYTIVSKLISTTISSSFQKSLTQVMRMSKLYNTENFFYYFEEKQEYTALLVDRQNEQTFNIQSNKLIDIVMYLDDREALYYRTYNNILDILGQIGGLLELMLFVVGLLVRPINKICCDLFLASEIFVIEQSNSKSRISPLKIAKHEVQLPDQINLPQNEINTLKKFFKLKANQVKLYFHQFLITCGNDRRIIQNSIEQIYNQIDIQFIINKMIEIDKLKKILLNEDQQIMFTYIHRPKISLGQQINMKKSMVKNCYDNLEVSFEQEVKKAFQAFQSIKQSSKKKDKKINENLLKLIDSDIKYLLEYQELSQKSQICPHQLNQDNSIIDLSLAENRIEI